MIDSLMLKEKVINGANNICQIACMKDNKLVFHDEYLEYKESDCVHVFSVTKSIVCLLIGICIDKGLIRSIDDCVLDYFKDYDVKKNEKTIYNVTIKHLLSMKAPYKGNSIDPWVKVCISDDWVKTSLDFLGGRKGITNEFRYTTVCLHILSGIITNVSGMKVVDFLNQYLLKPLEISPRKNYCALTKEEHIEFTLSKKPKEGVWFCDPQGFGCSGYGLCFSAIELAKIGNLILNKGLINNRKVVSSTWINQMFIPTTDKMDKFGGLAYGLLWWIIDQEKMIYGAIGDGGNIIYLNLKKNIVITITGYFKPRIFDRVDFIQNNIEKYII